MPSLSAFLAAMKTLRLLLSSKSSARETVTSITDPLQMTATAGLVSVVRQ